MVKFRIDVNDIVGREFGKLKVLWWDSHNGKFHRYRCVCQCGKLTTVSRNDLTGGKTKSCMCFHADNDEELRNLIMRIPPTRRGCRIWRGAADAAGYGMVSYNGKRNARIHVESARVFHGPRPESLVTMHSCACKMCCEPSHLSYGTHSQNHLDAYANEGRTKTGKAMTMEKARQVRAMYPRMTHKAIAKRMGCSVVHIGNIIRGVYWKEPVVEEPTIALPEDDWSSHNHYQPTFNF